MREPRSSTHDGHEMVVLIGRRIQTCMLAEWHAATSRLESMVRFLILPLGNLASKC